MYILNILLTKTLNWSEKLPSDSTKLLIGSVFKTLIKLTSLQLMTAIAHYEYKIEWHK